MNGSDIRAHQHSVGIADQAIFKSRGVHSSNVHLVVDSNGNPIDFIIFDGTTHDIKVASDLISKLDINKVEIVCADKTYDSEPLREQIRAPRTKANISKKSNNQSNNGHMD